MGDRKSASMTSQRTDLMEIVSKGRLRGWLNLDHKSQFAHRTVTMGLIDDESGNPPSLILPFSIASFTMPTRVGQNWTAEMRT